MLVRLWRADRAHLSAIRPHAVGLHSAARSRLFHRRHHACRRARAWSAPTASCARHRRSCCRGPAWRTRWPSPASMARPSPNAPNSGVVFVTLKPFEERVKAEAHDRRHPQRSARPDAGAARGLRAGDPAAVGPRHRHRRRLQALRPGPRRPRPARARAGGRRHRRRPPTRRPASCRCSRCSTPRRRRSMPTSTAPRPRCSACRSRGSSTPCRSIWARPSSTTSTSWAGPTG